jgi:hypothetical protein
VLRPKHVQEGTRGEAIVSGILSKKELADRIYKTKEWKDWLDKHRVEFFGTPVGSEWFKEHGPDWLCNTYLHKFKEGKKLNDYDKMRYAKNIKEIFNTKAWKDFINSKEGSEHLDCSGYQMFHGSYGLIRVFVNTPTNKEWIKDNMEKHFTANNDSWLIKKSKEALFGSDVWKELVNSQEIDQWFDTPSGKRVLLDMISKESFLYYCSVDFFKGKAGMEWIKSEEGAEFIQRTDGYFEFFRDKDSLKELMNDTEAGEELAKTKEFCKWLDRHIGGDYHLEQEGVNLFNAKVWKELIKNEHFWESHTGYEFINEHFNDLAIIEEVRQEFLKLIKNEHFWESSRRREFIDKHFDDITKIKEIRQEFIESLTDTEEGKQIMKKRKILILPLKKTGSSSFSGE